MLSFDKNIYEKFRGYFPFVSFCFVLRSQKCVWNLMCHNSVPKYFLFPIVEMNGIECAVILKENFLCKFSKDLSLITGSMCLKFVGCNNQYLVHTIYVCNFCLTDNI
jgi:hypothetical protein